LYLIVRNEVYPKKRPKSLRLFTITTKATKSTKATQTTKVKGTIMNVDTITISPDEAERKLAAARLLSERQRLPEDDRFEQLYRAIRGGARIMHLYDAFRQTGLNDKGQPKLAIARADWRTVHLIHRIDRRVACGFSSDPVWNYRATRRNIVLPAGTFGMDEEKLTWGRLYSPVPYVPPNVRPAYHLRNYHILFEVEQWSVYPHDPYLLKHVGGPLYQVMAEWDLTPLEVSLFGEIHQ
jgi:hypothetical protein